MATDQLTQRVEKLEKELESSKSSFNYQTKEKDRVKDEIEQIHQFLDASGAAERTREGKNPWDTVELTVLTRLAAWMGSKLK